MTPKNVKLRDQMGPDLFGKAVLKGKFCKVLPALIRVTAPDGSVFEPFQCLAACDQ
jgi:hypothetical protein